MFARENRFSFKSKLPKNTLNSASFNIKYEKNNAGLKVAVVVSKKVSKLATARNKIKRATIEALGDNLKLEDNLTLVLYVKAGVDILKLKNEINEVIAKIK